MSWGDLEKGNKALAEFGASRFAAGVAFLATVKKDGSPRLHPVSAILGSGRLFLFMEPTSPKRFDLLRGGRYTMHAAVEDHGGGAGEFSVSGTGTILEDKADWQLAAHHSGYSPPERYILFELTVDQAVSKVYQKSGPPLWQRWSAKA